MKNVDCDHLSLTHLHLITHTSVTNKMTETDRVKKPAAVEYTRIVMYQVPAVGKRNLINNEHLYIYST